MGGGGPADLQSLLAQLAQIVQQLSSIVAGMAPAAGAQAGVAGTQGSGVEAQGGGAVTGGGGAGGGCGCSGTADAAAGAVQQGRSNGAKGAAGAPRAAGADDVSKYASGNGRLDGSAKLTVKGQAISADQRRNAEIVLAVGQKMGASRKVLEASVATMIQESTMKNLDYGDRDSLGLFQQRPSQGWGTPQQVRDPEHAAREFFKRAIANDKKDPNQSLTQLAQGVQRSAFPDAYAQWSNEAQKIVGAFLGS